MNPSLFSLLVPYFEALLGGLLPILVWLWFWDHEDKHPEPKRLILLAFLAGMLATLAVIPFEKYAQVIFQNSPETIVVWAAIEEIFKLVAAWLVVLRRKENDEPVDSVIYMIAVALGFSALENAIFILPYILHGQNNTAFLVGNIRFIGATLLHTVSSGTLGIFLALSFYKNRHMKGVYLFFGLLVAIILHSLFNFSIILSNGAISLLPFFAVWIGAIVLLLLFERVKYMRKSLS